MADLSRETELDAYYAGPLSDYGGGNVEWWWAYIRAKLARAHEHYAAQVAGLSTPSGGESDRERLMRFAEAYDTEDSAQRGEPSPWRGLTVCKEDVAFVEERIACAKAGFAALASSLPAETEGGR